MTLFCRKHTFGSQSALSFPQLTSNLLPVCVALATTSLEVTTWKFCFLKELIEAFSDWFNKTGHDEASAFISSQSN